MEITPPYVNINMPPNLGPATHNLAHMHLLAFVMMWIY